MEKTLVRTVTIFEKHDSSLVHDEYTVGEDVQSNGGGKVTEISYNSTGVVMIYLRDPKENIAPKKTSERPMRVFIGFPFKVEDRLV